jgi:hypothetical protein
MILSLKRTSPIVTPNNQCLYRVFQIEVFYRSKLRATPKGKKHCVLQHESAPPGDLPQAAVPGASLTARTVGYLVRQAAGMQYHGRFRPCAP